MNVRWALEAEQDRFDIIDYIAMDNALAAIDMDELFGHAATRLADFPYLGHPGLIAGTQELIPHESYRLVYEISGETVWILALVNTSRQWPPKRRP